MREQREPEDEPAAPSRERSILAAARRTAEHDAAFRRELADRIGALNARVSRFNTLVPVAALQLVPLTSERVLELAAEP